MTTASQTCLPWPFPQAANSFRPGRWAWEGRRTLKARGMNQDRVAQESGGRERVPQAFWMPSPTT